MRNPVIIFINPDQFSSSGLSLRAGSFPIAWTTEGKRLELMTEQDSCCLIALNDNSETVPVLRYKNVDGSAPLVVITHLGSDHHRDPTKSLGAYGRVQLGIAFTHTANNAIFRQMKECLLQPARAVQFSQEHSNNSLYRTWDQLAAFFQLKLLQPEEMACDLAGNEQGVLNALVELLHPVQREDLDVFIDGLDWHACLDYVKSQGKLCCPT